MKVITKCPYCLHEVTAIVGTNFGALVKCYHCKKVIYIGKKEKEDDSKH